MEAKNPIARLCSWLAPHQSRLVVGTCTAIRPSVNQVLVTLSESKVMIQLPVRARAATGHDIATIPETHELT